MVLLTLMELLIFYFYGNCMESLKKHSLLIMASILLYFSTASSTFATTYSYTGLPYVVATAPYTTAMRITGSITTNTPIPPNTAAFDLSSATSWEFSDGVQTITSANDELLPWDGLPPSYVSTDATGTISSALILIGTTPLATTISDTSDIIIINSAVFLIFEIGMQDAICSNVSGAMCTSYDFQNSASMGSTGDFSDADFTGALPGVWELQQESIHNVPSLSTWGILILSLFLGFVMQSKLRFPVPAKSSKK